ncbi:MAG TPA: DedA family protein [Solirubrobacteraceae bacterium]
MHPVLASLTGPLVNLATHIIGSLGLAGVAVLNVTTAVIGVPGTEPVMLFAGFDVYNGHLTLVGIIAAGVLGDMIGASIAYAIGYFGRRELLERQGGKLHVNPQKLERAHRWSERHGAPAIFFSRMVPFARAAFPYAAGVAEMPFVKFALAALAGSIIWIGGLGVLGREVGSNWSSWRHHLEYVDYAVVALVLAGIAYLVVRRVRRRPAATDAPAAGEPSTSEQHSGAPGEHTKAPVDVGPR